MILKLNIDEKSNGSLTVIREENDPKFYGIQNAAGESALFHYLKKELNRQMGLDMIKKRMHKDGHLMDDMQQYLRERKTHKNPKNDTKRCICIYNHKWAVNGAEKDYNAGKVVLRVENIG